MGLDRTTSIKQLKKENFDLLVIGGGATGSGIAMDAALRGYRVAIIDAGDFASQTSSRSTKLLHGGVRYLEKAFKELDFKQFQLVKSGLEERATLLKTAPHLSRALPIVIPVYSKFQALYYWLGIKCYDLLSGRHSIGKSRYISQKEVLHYFPKLKSQQLKGGIIYYDGQFDDARMNVSAILTAASKGAVVANYVKVVDFKSIDGRLVSAIVEDQFTQEAWALHAKAIVNATGPFADTIRRLDNPSVPKRMVGSIGTHLVLDRDYAPKEMGLLIPKTADGRVLFLLPWEKNTLVGTTDVPVDIQLNPETSDEEIDYLIHHLDLYLGLDVKKEEIQSYWAGIRPLVSASASKKTAKLSRDFKIEKSASGLYSILGGKWTAFRKMAEKLLDQMIENEDLSKRGPCTTKETPLVGGESSWEGLDKMLEHLPLDVQDHLLHAYGTRSVEVANLARDRGLEARLHPNFPYIEAEVVWAMSEEMAQTEHDVLDRRLRLKTLNRRAAEEVLPRVKELMNQELACRD